MPLVLLEAAAASACARSGPRKVSDALAGFDKRYQPNGERG